MPVIRRLTAAPGVAPGRGFVHAVSAAGPLAFISGQLALDADGAVVGPGDLAAQTRQALANLHAILRELGAD
jgi:enamine deaminase RidA (YjgF/YER057c/UK114 family)